MLTSDSADVALLLVVLDAVESDTVFAEFVPSGASKVLVVLFVVLGAVVAGAGEVVVGVVVLVWFVAVEAGTVDAEVVLTFSSADVLLVAVVVDILTTVLETLVLVGVEFKNCVQVEL